MGAVFRLCNLTGFLFPPKQLQDEESLRATRTWCRWDGGQIRRVCQEKREERRVSHVWLLLPFCFHSLSRLNRGLRRVVSLGLGLASSICHSSACVSSRQEMKAPAYERIVKASRKAARNANMHPSKGIAVIRGRLSLMRRLNPRSDSAIHPLHASYTTGRAILLLKM